MNINALAPLVDGSEKYRAQMFGSRDVYRDLPLHVHPYHEKPQANQNANDAWSPRITMGCTVFSYLDIVENKGHNQLGEWWQIKPSEYTRLWNEVKRQGYGSDQNGAYLNGINKVMAEPGQYVELVQKYNPKTIKVVQKDWFIVANKGYSSEEFAASVMYEIAYGNGVQWGLVTQQSRLGFIESDNSPYRIESNDSPVPIAHAVPLVYYDKRGVAISDSGGDHVADGGVRWISEMNLRKGFSPIGFLVDIIS